MLFISILPEIAFDEALVDLVRDELRGTLSLSSTGGLRAEVVFPA